MESVVLVIHLFLALAIIGLVLLQRSEGGGLGIGGGGLGNLASAQGTASALTRITGICAACFFVTSLVLGILASRGHEGPNLIDAVSQQTVPAAEQMIDEEAGDVPVVPPVDMPDNSSNQAADPPAAPINTE